MKRFSIVAALLIMSEAALAGGGHVMGSVGMRKLDKDYFDPVDQQPAIGVLADFRLGDSPWFAAVGLQVSVDEQDDITAAVADFSAGIKFMPSRSAVRPYVGGGIASVGVAVEDAFGNEDDDQSFGYYISAGSLFRISGRFTMGLDLRWVGGTSGTLYGAKGDADSFVASALFGFGWGE